MFPSFDGDSEGERDENEKTLVVKLDDGSLTEIVKHGLAGGQSMLGYDTEVTTCRRCKIEK